MKNFITGMVLFSLHFFAFAENNITSEVLVGQSQNHFYAVKKNALSKDAYASSLNSTSYGLRVGVGITQHLTFELSGHHHGSVTNNVNVSRSVLIPGVSSNLCCFSSEFDETSQAKIPTEVNSIRFGIKGELEILTDTYLNARLGLAYWKYTDLTPQRLVLTEASSQNGSDIYYAVGADYKFTKNFYVGFEYSIFTINGTANKSDLYQGSFEHQIEDISLVFGWAF